MKITHINPPELHANPAFSQVVTVEGVGRTIIVGGQNAVNAAGEIVGAELATQTEQALSNVILALRAAGATQSDVVRMIIYIVQGHNIGEAFQAAQKVWGRHPTAISVLQVAGLANPRFLIEIEATAMI